MKTIDKQIISIQKQKKSNKSQWNPTNASVQKRWKNQAKAMKTIEKAKPKQWNHWFHLLFPYAPAAAEVIGTFSYAHITRDLRRACLAQKTLLNGH